MHKYQYGGKGLGKNKQGIIEPIPNEVQHKRIIGIGFDESEPSTHSITLTI